MTQTDDVKQRSAERGLQKIIALVGPMTVDNKQSSQRLHTLLDRQHLSTFCKIKSSPKLYSDKKDDLVQSHRF